MAQHLNLKPSFENCSYYFSSENIPNFGFTEFRKRSESTWHRAFKPVYDDSLKVWKGSIFNLTENSDWQVRIISSTGKILVQKDFRTWNAHPVVARTIDLSKISPNSEKEILITEKGKSHGWIRYTAPKGWVLRPGQTRKAAIHLLRANYVILENITIEGGYQNAINVDSSSNIRIINCDISNWGRIGKQDFSNSNALGQYKGENGEVINYDAGIVIYKSLNTVVERCYIHDPRSRANSWMFSHPTGPCAVEAKFTLGGTVLRYNDLVGSDEHRWNDVVESEDNVSVDGGFYRDSDIYGNFFAFGNDDGIELEGGGMNVRFYKNKIEGTLCGVSTGACLIGPQYVINNLITNLSDEGGLALDYFKNIIGFPQGGQRFIFNNTTYGFNGSAYSKYGQPLPGRRLGTMRNNIFLCKDSVANSEWLREDDFDNDLFWAENSVDASQKVVNGFKRNGQEPNAVVADPQLVSPEKGDYHLAPQSMARKKSVGVDNIAAQGSDLGAFVNDKYELPFRPTSLIATPRQVKFDAPQQTNTVEITLSLPAIANAPCHFDIRKNKVFNWFDVQPATGTIKPGQTILLKLTADSKKLRGRPLFRGAFLVRMANGISRPVTVYAKGEYQEDRRPASAPNSVYLQPKGEMIDTSFAINHTTDYYLLVRAALKENLNERYFQARIDLKNYRLDFAPKYIWTKLDNGKKMIFLKSLATLCEGNHTISVNLPGDMIVDELIITDNPADFFIQEAHKK